MLFSEADLTGTGSFTFCDSADLDDVSDLNVVSTADFNFVSGLVCQDGNGGCGIIGPRDAGGPVCGNNVVEVGETCDDGGFVNGDGCSSTCQIEDVIPPTIPTGLVANAVSESQIDLTWTAATDNSGSIDHYNVYRDGALVGSPIGTSYSDTGLLENTAYSYTVSAVDAAGNEGGQSAAVVGTTLSDTTPPSIVSANAVTDTSVEVVFDEDLEVSSAVISTNYVIDNGISVSSASLGVDLRMVTLTTSIHSEGVSYNLDVSGVSDMAGNSIVLSSVGYTYTALLSGLVGHWKFDEGSGSVASDSSGNGNDGTITGAVRVAGKVGGALDFDGVDDFAKIDVNSPSLDITGNQITLSAWINPRALGVSAGSRIISKRTSAGGSDVYALGTFGTNVFFRISGSSDLISVTNFVLNDWIHVTVVYDGASKIIYINGVRDPVLPQALSANILSSTSSVHIGMRDMEARRFDGLIDEAMVFDRALSDSEVLSLYNLGVGPPLPCVLTNAAWSVSNAVENDLVNLIVSGSNCVGVSLDYTIMEYDPTILLPDDLVISFVLNSLNPTWTALYLDEGGLDPDPEYYFEVFEVGNPINFVSSGKGAAELLSVSQAVGGPVCGDGNVDAGEVCDGANLNGQSCSTQGFDIGALACASDCLSFDTSGCSIVAPPVCGDGNVDIGEECDDSGTVSGDGCSATCQFEDLSQCVIEFDASCPNAGIECGASFSGGLSCVFEAKDFCYYSGTQSYKLNAANPVTVNFSGNVNSLDVFFSGYLGSSGTMTFFDEFGVQVDSALTTNGDCSLAMPSKQFVNFSRAVHSAQVVGTGDVYIDSFDVNSVLSTCAAADVNGDGKVNVLDLVGVIVNGADANGDGVVNILDLVFVVSRSNIC